MGRFLFAALLAGSVGLAACSSDPEGTVDAFSVKLGDCLDNPISGGAEELEEVEDVATVPCGEPHDGEVFAVFDLPDGDFPGDDAVSKAAEDRCISDFEPFVGVPYDGSALDFFTFQPTKASWETQDDREIVCVVGDSNAKTTGTLQGAAR